MVGEGQTGPSLARATPARYALNVLLGHVEKMRCDGDITASQHNPGTLDPCCDGVCVAGGVLLDRPVADLRFGNIGEGRQIGDALLGLLAPFDRPLASPQTPPPPAPLAR